MLADECSNVHSAGLWIALLEMRRLRAV